MNLDQFLNHILITDIKYHMYENKLSQYELIDTKHHGECYECKKNCELILSHSMSRGWYKKNNYQIYSLVFDPILTQKNYPDSYRIIQIFFSSQTKDGNQYTHEFAPSIKKYISSDITNNVFHNIFESSISYYKYYVHSTFNLLCGICDKKYETIDKDSFIDNFSSNTVNHHLLLERFEFYFYSKQKNIENNFILNSNILQNNMTEFSNIYLKDNNLAIKIPLLIEKAIEKLNKLRQELIKTKIENHRHSFICKLLTNSEFVDLFDLYYSDDFYYNNIHQSFLNIIQFYISNPNNLHEIFSYLNLEHINTIYTNMLQHKKNMENYLSEYQNSALNNNLQNYHAQVITTFFPKLYGFSKISMSLLNKFFETHEFSDHSYVYLFVSPETKKGTVITSYFIEDNQKQILNNYINKISKQNNFSITKTEQILFFYAFISSTYNINIYSQQKMIINHIVSLQNDINKCTDNSKILCCINEFLEKK